MNCYQASLKLLAKRDYSNHKLSKKLLEKGFESEEINETIDKLLEKKYLREELYVEAVIKGNMRKGYSPNYIQQKLAQENCQTSLEVINGIFDEYDFSEEMQIRDLIAKKYSKLDLTEFKNKVKVTNFLLRKGHELQLAQEVINDFS